MHGKGETGIIASIIAPYPGKSSVEVCNNIVVLETWERALAREEVAAGFWRTMFLRFPSQMPEALAQSAAHSAAQRCQLVATPNETASNRT